ncbi:MAG: hypothetical protein H6519_05125 [Microthrixaceae bacterium]|nr:hypothetical protein [Acidimicrobiales bacterium]MCB9403800.1 hypothetical protein [Microthrixaceae bacterium]
MLRSLRAVGCVLAVFAASVLVSGGVASAAPMDPPGVFTCRGGDFDSNELAVVPSGTYNQLRIAGACRPAPGAVIRVRGSLFVTPGSAFDAQSAPSTITVFGNVNAAAGSILGLGCQPPSMTGNSAHECVEDPGGHSTISVMGSVNATDVNTLLLNGVSVRRNVNVSGGGGFIPWSIKNNIIGGNLNVSGVTTNWFGAMFNTVGGDVNLFNITSLEFDHPGGPVYVVRNTVGRNLTCVGLVPGVSGGFRPGPANEVGLHTFGQCVGLTGGGIS